MAENGTKGQKSYHSKKEKKVIYFIIIFYIVIISFHINSVFFFSRQRSTVSKFLDLDPGEITLGGAITPTHINFYHTIILHPLTSIFITLIF